MIEAVAELQASTVNITTVLIAVIEVTKKVCTRLDVLEVEVDALQQRLHALQDKADTLDEFLDGQDALARYRCYIERFCRQVGRDIDLTWDDVVDALDVELFQAEEEGDKPVTRKFQAALCAVGLSWDDWQGVCCIAQASNFMFYMGGEVTTTEALRQLREGEVAQVRFPHALRDKVPALQKILEALLSKRQKRQASR